MNQLCSTFERSEPGTQCQGQDQDSHYRNGEVPDYFNGSDPLRGVDRRTRPETRRTFEVSKMWERHHEITRRLLLGQKASSIAEDLGVSKAMVGYVRNSKVVQEKLALMEGARDAETVDLAIEIRKRAPQALKLLDKIITGEVEAPITARAREANNWLDRAGFAPVRSVTAQHVHTHYTSDDINEIKRLAVENGFAQRSVLNEKILDAEIVNE